MFIKTWAGYKKVCRETGHFDMLKYRCGTGSLEVFGGQMYEEKTWLHRCYMSDNAGTLRPPIHCRGKSRWLLCVPMAQAKLYLSAELHHKEMMHQVIKMMAFKKGFSN